MLCLGGELVRRCEGLQAVIETPRWVHTGHVRRLEAQLEVYGRSIHLTGIDESPLPGPASRGFCSGYTTSYLTEATSSLSNVANSAPGEDIEIH